MLDINVVESMNVSYIQGQPEKTLQGIIYYLNRHHKTNIYCATLALFRHLKKSIINPSPYEQHLENEHRKINYNKL